MLIANAYAQSAAPAAGPGADLLQLLPIVLMFVILYFLMIIRPQMKKAKEHKTMVEALTKGDEVVTQGGIAGRITKVGENFVQIELSENVNVAVQKQAVATILPKGTLKTL